MKHWIKRTLRLRILIVERTADFSETPFDTLVSWGKNTILDGKMQFDRERRQTVEIYNFSPLIDAVQVVYPCKENK